MEFHFRMNRSCPALADRKITESGIHSALPVVRSYAANANFNEIQTS